jgi:two-component system, cell cycle response regulator DivK
VNHRILIVEDNPDNMALISWVLEDEGYEFVGADCAEAALELLEQQVFGLVLMDISLPGMDGKEATRRIRSNAEHASLPIVAVTAHAIEHEKRLIQESGTTTIVTKPIDEALLLTTIKRLLAENVNHGESASC